MPYDYYKLLGVTPAADQELIAKAYRLRARQHHPDRGGDRLQFQQVEDAYQTLIDPRRRLHYDRAVLADNGGAYGGGPDIYQIVPLRFEQAARGGRVAVTCLGPHPRRMEVQIPSAARDGDRLRLAGQGLARAGGGPPGDLILVIAVEPHPRLRYEGLDVLTEVDVSLETALHGGRVSVQGLDGLVLVDVPAGTTSGDRLRARAAGLRTGDGRYGDLYACVRVQIPRAAGATPRTPPGESMHQRLAEQARKLGRQREELEARLAELQGRAVVAEQEQASLAADRQRLLEGQAQWEVRWHELENRAHEIEALSQKLAAERLALDQDVRSARSAAQSLQSEHQELAAERTRLAEESAKLIAMRQDLEATGRELDLDRRQLEEERAAIQAREKALAELSAAMEERQERVKQQELQAQALQQKLNEDHLRVEALSAGLESQQRQFDEARAALDQRSADVARKAADIEVRRQELADQQQALEAGRAQAAQELESARQLLRQVEAQRRELETRRQELERQARAQAQESDQRDEELRQREARWLQRTHEEAKRAGADQKPGAVRLPTVALIMADGQGRTHRYELVRREITIGRDRPAELRIALPTVSRMHCRLEVWPSGVWVEDLGSRNGTFRNRGKVTRNRVQAGDVMRVGEAHLAVQIDGRPDDPRPPATVSAGHEWPVEFTAALRAPDEQVVAPRPRPRDETPTAQAAGETVAGRESPQEAPAGPVRRPKLSMTRPMEVVAPRFALKAEGHNPVFDLAPHHVRSAAGYIDRSNRRHLFVDFVDAKHKSAQPWTAEIRYYRQPAPGALWEWVAAVAGGNASAKPCVRGAASPHVVCVAGRVLLFYARRSTGQPDEPIQPLASASQAGCLHSAVALASAAAAPDGSPQGAFEDHGVIIEPGTGWDALRLDHPCAVIDGEHLHVFYTAYDDAADLSHRVVGCATARIAEQWSFVRHPAPVLSVPGGGQMPRVFRHRGMWHMFYQHFRRTDGARWRHYIATDPLYWRERDPQFFDPPHDQGELMLWSDPTGRLPREPRAWMSAARPEIFKMFEHRLEIRLG